MVEAVMGSWGDGGVRSVKQREAGRGGEGRDGGVASKVVEEVEASGVKWSGAREEKTKEAGRGVRGTE